MTEQTPDKANLIDFQSYLANRLDAASTAADGEGWLGLQVGEQHWLLDLADGGEIIQAPVVTPVPMTQPWFLGLANVRGTLVAVSDFSAFLGGRPQAMDQNSRLVLVGHRHGANVALLVGKLLGLRKPAIFSEAQVDPALPPWGATQHVDKHGTLWHRLAVRELMADPRFMQVAR